MKTHDFFFDQDGFIFFNNITFYAVNFQLFGSCIKISQHIKHQVQINTLKFENTISGQIFIIPDNIKEERYPTSVRLINFSGLNNNSKYSTLIRVEDGAHLDLTDSYFADNFNFERGGVMR
jgi:hypothetical protein